MMRITIPKGYVRPKIPLRDKWLKALRSGEFTQGKRELRCINNNGIVEYCCLGVISSLQGRLKDCWGNPIDPSFQGTVCDFGEEYYSKTILAEDNPLAPFIGGSGFFPSSVTVEFNGATSFSLASLNDAGASFTEIAQIIETVWDNLPDPEPDLFKRLKRSHLREVARDREIPIGRDKKDTIRNLASAGYFLWTDEYNEEVEGWIKEKISKEACAPACYLYYIS
jgi:hypothetical protein